MQRREGGGNKSISPIICAICLRGVFMKQEKDLVRLADYLGHSSIETTRRYTMLTSEEVCKKINWNLICFPKKTGGEYERHNMYYVVHKWNTENKLRYFFFKKCWIFLEFLKVPATYRFVKLCEYASKSSFLY